MRWFEWRTAVLFALACSMVAASLGAALLPAEVAPGPASARPQLLIIAVAWVLVAGTLALCRQLGPRGAWATIAVSLCITTTCALVVDDASWRWLCIATVPTQPALAVMHQRGRALAILVCLSVTSAVVLVAHTGLRGEFLLYALVVVAPLSVVPCAVIFALTRVLEGLRAAADRAARTDPLTGLLNRYGQARAQGDLVRSAAAAGEALGLVLLDIDRFKTVNDVHGHAVGDAVIVTVADVVRQQVGPHDLVVRHGGEEIVVLAAVRAPDEIAALAERIRVAVAAHAAPRLPAVTISAGTAVADPTAAVAASGRVPTEHPADEDAIRRLVISLVVRADAALYDAKRAGRNCVHHHGATSHVP